ncbi:MAG: transglycosylase domain-containing protein [Deltaproteobacteria bacterium]|jgi:penicillin-binding protein 1C|nr:transglycosylase domain-containing protein [Deltaproteobacteria bacterium]
MSDGISKKATDLNKSALPGAARSFFKKALRFCLGGAALMVLSALVGYWLVEPPDPTNFNVSPVLRDNRGEPLHVGLSAQDEILIPMTLAQIGERLPAIAIAVEDKRFRRHPGVDVLAVMRAIAQNVKSRSVVSGASTITVQLVRLSRPRPRTVRSKLMEFLEAVKLEQRYSKDEILELYLNKAPFGGNLRGVGAASRAYFNKKPADLTLGECALLVALLRGPSVYRPDRWPQRAQVRRDKVLDNLYAHDQISLEARDLAKAELVSSDLQKPPRLARHLAMTALDVNGSPRWKWGQPGFMGQETTIDRQKQELLAGRLEMALKPFPQAVNGAGLVLSNADGRILAYVGGVRRTGEAHFVDNVRSRRSPGSTLKPFIYLAAFSDGSLSPASVLADTPLHLMGEAPRNFDGVYRGPVSAAEALSSSLNAPAARVLRLVGEERALSYLKSAGLTIPNDVRVFGDSLVLGGMETTMLHLAGAYGALARGGLSLTPSLDPAASGEGSRIFGEEAVWLVNEALTDDKRLPPGLRGDRLAFKSGTSNGLRDAWLAIYEPNITMILWLGDPVGRAHRGLSGLSSLASAGVNLMRDFGSKAKWPDPPEGLEMFPACPISGEPVSPFCPGSRWSWRLAGFAKSHPCRLHVRRQGEIVTLWPKELARFMGSEESLSGPASLAPRIVSPLPDSVVVMDENNPSDRLPLKSEGSVGRVHWFVDDVFLAAADNQTSPFVSLGSGPHVVTMIDSRSRVAKSEFSVVPPQTAVREIKPSSVLSFD